MIGIILAVVIGILLLGLVLKLLWIAIVIAAAVGLVMFAQNKLGKSHDSGRLK